MATRSSAYLSGRRTLSGRAVGELWGSSWATWLVQIGPTRYRLTYRTNMKEEPSEKTWLGFQLASLQCLGKWAGSFT